MRKLMCSFGVLLLTLLAGWHLFLDGEYDNEAYYLVDWVRSCVGKNQVIKVIDKAMLEEGNDHKQFLPFAEVASSCISDIAEDRPTMIDAGKQLRVIYEYLSPP